MRALRAVAAEWQIMAVAVGFASIVVGAALIWPPAAFLLGGLVLIVLAFVGDRAK